MTKIRYRKTNEIVTVKTNFEETCDYLESKGLVLMPSRISDNLNIYSGMTMIGEIIVDF